MIKFKKAISVFLLLTGITFALQAQAPSVPQDSVRPWQPSVGLFPKKEPSHLSQITVSGYYRFFATYVQQYKDYVLNPIINDTVLPRTLFIGDDSQLPNLLLNVAGRPNDKTAWGFDIYMFQFLNGRIGEAYSKQVTDSLQPSVADPLNDTRLAGNLIVHLGINLYGSYLTDVGTYKIRAGGIHWFALSDLTMASFKGYERYILFEDNPWDPVGNSIDTRYNKYYTQGAIDQDNRWGNRAFTGLILEGSELPGKLNFALLYGKSEINGGFSQTPNYSYGGQVKKIFNQGQFIALNSMNSMAYSDSLAKEGVGFNMVTTEGNVWLRQFQLKAEIGGGRYFSPVHTGGWGEAINTTVITPSKNNIPQFNVQYFRISPKVINNTAAFINTAISEYDVSNIPAGSVGSSTVLQPTGSSMVRLGQMTNNRQGVNINADFHLGEMKFGIGTGFSAELEALSNEITFGHPVNQLTRARFWRFAFPTGVGPYERYSVIYRDTYETAHLSDDSSGIAVNKKYFNVTEAQIKYKMTLLNRDLYLFYLGQYSSAQRNFSLITVTTEEAYIRQYASEFELYYHIFKPIMITAYFGYERTIGNYLTDIDEITRRPINQYGKGLGMGLDIDMGKNARLYLRNRWFEFEDTSFAEDHFKGNETVAEFKIFF